MVPGVCSVFGFAVVWGFGTVGVCVCVCRCLCLCCGLVGLLFALSLFVLILNGCLCACLLARLPARKCLGFGLVHHLPCHDSCPCCFECLACFLWAFLIWVLRASLALRCLGMWTSLDSQLALDSLKFFSPSRKRHASTSWSGWRHCPIGQAV